MSVRLSVELKGKEGCGPGSGKEPGMGLLSSAPLSSCMCQGLRSNTKHRNHRASNMERGIERTCALYFTDMKSEAQRGEHNPFEVCMPLSPLGKCSL